MVSGEGGVGCVSRDRTTFCRFPLRFGILDVFFFGREGSVRVARVARVARVTRGSRG